MRWLIDAMNVMGARPDGWWKDRRGATHRIAHAVETWAHTADGPVVLVVDGRPDGALCDLGIALEFGDPSRGGADARIVELCAATGDPTTVVTSDRALADAVRALGATVVGSGTFRDWLEEACPPRRLAGFRNSS